MEMLNTIIELCGGLKKRLTQHVEQFNMNHAKLVNTLTS